MNYSLDTLLYGMQFRRLMEKEMAPIETTYGLQKIDMQILIYLKHAKELNTSKDIMKMNMFTRGHISQSLSRLQKKGLVRMEQDQEDRRCTHNYLTDTTGMEGLQSLEYLWVGVKWSIHYSFLKTRFPRLRLCLR